MSDDQAERDRTHSTWAAFVSRHTGNSFLEHDPLYALTEPLIDAIQVEIPGFFTQEQEQFERDLARTASFGFSLGRTFGISLEVEANLQEKWEERDRAINMMLRDELQRSGADRVEVDDYFERSSIHREKIAARMDAYAGWLILNPTFMEERRRFRNEWENALEVFGQFPVLRMFLMPDPTEEMSDPTGFRDACYQFYCRWSLDTFLTWDWPVPMEPDLHSGLRQNDSFLSEGGVFLFLPWYLLRGETIDLREVVRRSRVSTPEHLLDWVAKRSSRKGDNFGDIRYGTLRWLYRFLELVLRRRFGARCKTNFQRLDRAFARVLHREENLMKKLRLEMSRGLNQDRADHCSD